MRDTAFESLVNSHYEGLYRFALSLARREDEAADLTQETFYRYATKGGQLRDASKARSWLFTTLYRQFLAKQRHSSRFPHAELTESEAELPVIESDAVGQLDVRLVLDALHGLEETFRAPLALFYLGDHSYRDIARILDIPIGTVMSRLSRGKEILRRKMMAEPSSAPKNILQLQTETPRQHHG
jgi:RNA polymerase sigma-70 factor (ECF subfamily)